MAKKAAAAGAPAWIVTFADLMSLLVCFFVLIISFSVPDIEKLKIAAGSIRDAFGFTREIIVTGVVEMEGNPMFKFAQDVQMIQPPDVVGPIPDIGREMQNIAAFRELMEGSEEDVPPASEAEAFDQIERELREAIATIPELKELAANLHIEQTPEGLKIQLLDQAEMSMFPLGSAVMYDPTRTLLGKVAQAVEGLPNEIEIAGHTDSYGFRRRDGYDNWSLSLDRADATRKVLVAAGLDTDRIAGVIGRADTDHVVADNPFDPRNRRISITLLREPARAVGASSAASSPPRSVAAPVRASAPEREERRSLYSIAPRF
jgi:chemotaxis protein MotB